MRNFFKSNGFILFLSLLIIGVALIGSPYNQSHNFLLKTAFFQTFILGLFLLFILRLFLFKGWRIRFPLKYPILVFCGYSLLSLLFSQYKYASFPGFLRVSYFFLLYLLVVNVITDFKRVSFLVKTVIVSTGLVSLIGLLQVLGISFTAWIPAFPSRITSTFGNPNFLGSFLAITLPLTAVSYLSSANRKKLIYLAIFLLGFVGLLLTRSRGAIAASILSFLFMGGIIIFGRLQAFIERRRSLAFLGLLVVVVLFVFIFLDSGSESLAKRFSEAAPGEGSLFYRLKIWESTLNLIRHNFFFGTGLGTFQIYFPQYAVQDFYKLVPIGNLLHSENEYLEIWSESGIIGLVLFLWIISGVFYLALKFINSKAEIKQRIIATGLLTGISAGLVQGLVCVSLRWSGPDFFFWLSICLLMALISYSEKSGRDESNSLSLKKLPGGLKVILYVLIATFTALFGIWQIKGYSANIYLARAQAYINIQSKVKAIPELEQAYTRNPYCLEAIFLLGCLNLELQGYSESENWFAKLQNLAPDYGNIHEWKGLLFNRSGKFEQAEEEYKKAVKMNGSGMNHNFLGEAYASQGKFDLAEKEFQKSTEMDSTFVTSQINLVQLDLLRGKYDRMLEKGEKVLKMSNIIKEEKGSLELLLATACLKLNRPDEAMIKIDSIIAWGPDSTQKDKIADLLQRSAWEMVKKNQSLNRALVFCDKALSLKPSHPEIIYDTQGWVYFRKGEYSKAQALMKKAVEKSPENEKFQRDLEIVSNALKGIKQEIEIK
ncbi:MAG: O-antigen ligase family protein [candidate division Zixibacteria bacterium]|nr:O-antigen ligase family protein [candidate division Zixibacteria bacterium]